MRQYGGLAAFGTLGATFRPLFAQAQTRVSDGSASIPLPNRGEFVIRNGFILTMDPALGDIPRGSVHVRNGEIVAVGADVTAPGVEVIDATDMIVLPGLTETHWHMWNTLFRSFAGDEQAHGYFPTVARFGAVMTPDDMYQGARLSAAEAINTGMTTVHDWCHNIRSREHAERDIQALKDAGIRTRFSYGWSQGQDDKDIINLRDLEALHREWHKHAAEGLITLGLGWRGKFRAGPLPENVFTHRIRSHAGNGNSADGPHPEPKRTGEANRSTCQGESPRQGCPVGARCLGSATARRNELPRWRPCWHKGAMLA